MNETTGAEGHPPNMSDAIEKLRQIGESLLDPDFAVQLFEDGYPDAIIVVDIEGSIKLVNRHFELMFGYHRSELYDRPIELLIPVDERTKHQEYRSQYVVDPHTRPMGRGLVLQGLHKSGRKFDVEISLSPVIAKQGYFTIATVRKRRVDVGER